MDSSVWFLFVIFFINYTNTNHTGCMTGLETVGYTIPRGDISIEYGQPLDLTCVLYEDKVNGSNSSSLMTFTRRNEKIPSEMIEYYNATSIKLHINNPPKVISDSYSCHYNGSIVCMNIVAVGVKPQNVTDFKCIGYNYENLTCTWTPPQNYVKTDYKLSFSLKRRRMAKIDYMCPKLETIAYKNGTEKLSCTWTPHTDPFYRPVHEYFYFVLTMNNTFGENQLEKTFRHFANVLSGPPVNLTSLSTTPSSIHISWHIPVSMEPFGPGLHHRIMYQCEYAKEWKFGGLLKEKEKSHLYGFNITGLSYPHELCDIRVSLRTSYAAKDDESMWSSNASITVRTSSVVPQRPPVINIGGYEIDSGHNLEYSNVFIYWKQINEVEKNGEDFKYEVKVEDYPGIRPVTSVTSFAKFENLLNSKSYQFNVWSVNKIGRSQLHSTITVPKLTERISEPLSFTKVEFQNGTFELNWEAPKKAANITNYTIFWCKSNRDRPYACNGELDWEEVPRSATSHRITLSNTVYQFAISANTQHSSSGMLWAACTIIHNQTIGKMKNVWINRLSSTFIEVGWKLECSDGISSVKGFIIYYCPIGSPTQINCKEPQKNATFTGSSIISGRITDLTPYTTYMLTVSVISAHNSYSRQSDQLFNTTFEAAPSTPPLNLHAVQVTNSSITLKWDPPRVMNGVLKNYVLQFNNITKNLETTNYTWTDLQSYVTYDITILACTTICSKKSEVLSITTLMGYPSKIEQPKAAFQNSSIIEIVWPRPERPGGNNDFFQVKMVEKFDSENTTIPIINVTDKKMYLTNCAERKSSAFFVSVRAVNVAAKNKTYEGPWSDELQYYCSNGTYWIYIFASLGIIVFFVIAFGFNKLYSCCKEMRDVEVKLPPGLDPGIADVRAWNPVKDKREEDRDSHSPAADEELLLVKMSETRQLSGDSSGCSSGHESVTSSLESGTHLSNTSDSGTEQTVGGNYCVLGVDPKDESPYIPVVSDAKLPAYISCDVASHQSSPYVMAGEPIKSLNPGYIPFNQNENTAKSSAYVVAGMKSGYIPFNQTETVNKNTGYVVTAVKNCKLD